MLYPIELLRQLTACMVTGTPLFVMSSMSFLTVGRFRTGLNQTQTSCTASWLEVNQRPLLTSSCKLHYSYLPSLQFAIFHRLKDTLTHCI